MKVKASRRSFLRSIIAGTVCVVSSTGFAWGQAGTAQRPPNVILIVVDDLGWSDVGCNGAKFYETPHIDKLASQGVRFTNAYAASPVCSPTRASLLTGRVTPRHGLTNIPDRAQPNAKVLPAPSLDRLEPSEVTIAEMLHPAGYVSASVGKWHLGRAPQWMPLAQGFDTVAGAISPGMPDYSQFYMDFDIPGKSGDFLQDNATDLAVEFVEKNQGKPFFLYYPMFAVHRPIMGKPGWVKHFQEKFERNGATNPEGQSNVTYAALIASADDAVGRLCATLEELHLADNTLVIFTSDNGGLEPVSGNAPLRSGKGTMYEGGLRVPLVVRWPGVTPPGTTSDVPVDSCDLFPTIRSAAGVAPDPAITIDGQDLKPILTGTGETRRPDLFWHYPHYHLGAPASVIRSGDFKLIEQLEDGALELYDLKNDIGETLNLAVKKPELTQTLHEKLIAWRVETGAKMPTRLDQIVPVEK